MTHGPEDIHSKLAALADGTAQGALREQVLAQVATDPELAAELERQRRALALVGTLERVAAPEVLRRSIEALAAGEGAPAGVRASRAPHTPRRRTGSRLRLRLPATVALAAAAAVVVVLTVSGGGHSGSPAAPTVLQTSRTALQPATGPAPAESVRDEHHLALVAAGTGIRYPYWGARPLAWQATGVRTDAVGGRTVTTVFYADHAGSHIGYSIVSGAALPVPAGATTVVRHGVTFHVVRSRDPTVVTWRAAGHTCILTARAVGSSTLVRLAAWRV